MKALITTSSRASGGGAGGGENGAARQNGTQQMEEVRRGAVREQMDAMEALNVAMGTQDIKAIAEAAKRAKEIYR